jgi:hypothetical protein
MSEKYQFEELDGETQQYLLYARDQKGKGVPGVYAEKSNLLPVIGVIAGFAVMVTTLFLTFPPTNHPVREAMLQTAGFLLGGWMVVAALRVWAGSKSGSYAGHFVYADSENLYEADGGTVEVTDLYELRDAKAVANFNEGKYQNTDITLKLGKRRKTVQVSDEERARRMTVFLNTVSYMRDGGEDGNDDELRKLSPEAMGAVAKQVARTGEFPRRLSDAEEADMVRVAQPKREGRPSAGILALLATVVVGLVMFFCFRLINAPLRDHAIFNQIRALPSREQPVALRLYLTNPDFKRHRDEAQKMLEGHYDKAVTTNVNGNDPQMKQAFAELILALKTKPQAVASLVAVEEAAQPGQEGGSGKRENDVQFKLADKWGSTVGDELVVFAALADPENPDRMDKSAKGMIDLRWKFTDKGDLQYTIEFRKGPDEAPYFSRIGTMEAQQTPDQMVQAVADKLLEQTIGTVRMRQVIQPEDF